MRALVALTFLLAGCATVRPTIVGQSFAPELPRLEGGAFSWSDAHGKPVVVDIWASWCNACAAELPAFARLQQEWGGETQYVGVNLDADPKAALAFQNATGSQGLLTLSDRNARFVSSSIPIRQLPTRLFIDRDGVVRATQEGFAPGDEEKIRAAVTSLKSEPARQ